MCASSNFLLTPEDFPGFLAAFRGSPLKLCSRGKNPQGAQPLSSTSGLHAMRISELFAEIFSDQKMRPIARKSEELDMSS